MDPDLISRMIGPRTIGTRYRENGKILVEVIAIDHPAFDWPGSSWAVTVRELDGPTRGRVRRHCTSWTLDGGNATC